MKLSGQLAALLEYLRKHPEGIDRKAAEDELGIYWLACRIRDLKKRGFRFRTIPRKVPTRYRKKDGTAKTTTIVSYVLVEEKRTEEPASSTEGESPDKDGPRPPASSRPIRYFEPPKIDKRGQRRMF
jgi:hypothetical protein